MPEVPCTSLKAAREAPADVIASPSELAGIIATAARRLIETTEATSVNEPDDVPTEQRAERAGHAYSVDSLFAGKYEALEQALWGAIAALEEQVDFCGRMQDRFKARGLTEVAATYAERSEEAKKQATRYAPPCSP